MCNKRRSYLKSNSVSQLKRTFKQVICFSCIIVAGWGCAGDQKPLHSNEVIKTDYPELSDAIILRDAESLIEYIDHENEHVRSLAWRALAKSDIENPDYLIQKVLGINETAGWFALSFITLQDGQLNRIEELLLANPPQYSESCEVFRRQGVGEHAVRLLSILDRLDEKKRCATAIGTILSREEISDDEVRQIIETAFLSDHSDVRNNLLYGIYRSSLNRPDAGTELFKVLENKWADTGIGRDHLLDQYMIRITGEEGADRFINERGGIRGINDIQVLIELARTFSVQDQLSDERRELIKELLVHNNPHVVMQTLERLKEQHTLDEQLIGFIHSRVTIPVRNHEIFLTSLEFLQQNNFDISNLTNKIEFAEKQNPYLADRVLGIYKKMESNEDFRQRIQQNIEEGGVRGMHSTRSLSELWIDGEVIADTAWIHDRVRHAVEAGDRSVLSALNTLLTDEELINEGDFEWINTAYLNAVDQSVEDNFDALELALETRFPHRFERLTDDSKPHFRTPDWERLYSLGTRPVWRLETDKGVIEIRLDPLTAPFTVSSIDSLTRAGLYNDVAFHRVVRNFVVQGGDFDRRDGFGSPDYTIPTEPSLHSFKRAAAGIASSGTDTEGSQYFFMHQWAPHLDGNYTLFGEVIRGMDVVDRLQIGDRVVRASVTPDRMSN
ncbi:hypothetical protein BH23BAC3_BH23BAC3_10490 [soil metagenome]